MRICIARSPGDRAQPPVETVIVSADDPDDVIAVTVGGNPLAPDWEPPDPSACPARAIVLWSGTLGEDLFEPHPRTWLAPGREALDERCARLAPFLAEAGMTASFRTHCRHVLSDAPSSARFLTDHEAEPLGIAFDPGGIVEPSMLDTLEDHLERTFATLGGRAAFVMLRDLELLPEGGGCRPVPLGRGVMPRSVLRGLLAEFISPGTPVVLEGDAIDEQRAWLQG